MFSIPMDPHTEPEKVIGDCRCQLAPSHTEPEKVCGSIGYCFASEPRLASASRSRAGPRDSVDLRTRKGGRPDLRCQWIAWMHRPESISQYERATEDVKFFYLRWKPLGQ